MAKRAAFVCALLAALLLCAAIIAGAPRSIAGELSGPDDGTTGADPQAARGITYQGVLKDASGIPVKDASLNIVFRIYNNPEGGALIWEKKIGIKTDQAGCFSTVLTDIELDVGGRNYLSLQVEGDSQEMIPRQALQLAGSSMITGGDSSPPIIAQTRNWDGDGEVIWPDTLWGISHAERGLGIGHNRLYGREAETHINLGIGSITGTSGQDYSYATVGGGYTNKAESKASTVGGGQENEASASYSTVAGGAKNHAIGSSSFVGGGYNNSANGAYNTISGGKDNVISQLSAPVAATIGGGEDNEIGGNYNTIGGGYQNAAEYGPYSTIAGGKTNTANGDYSAIGGGISNSSGGDYSGVGGGTGNSASGGVATVAGGGNNTASGDGAAIAGGSNNTAGSSNSAIGGGNGNNASGPYSVIAGGTTNTASGARSSVPGGMSNTASGDYSLAAGRRAKAIHEGAFVWADAINADFSSTSANQFWVRATGGVGFFGTATTPATFVFGHDGSNNDLAVDNSGNVGVGTGSPSAKLDIAATGDGVEVLRLSTERSWAFRQLNTGQYAALELASIGGGGNKDFVINTTGVGKVGIGTTSPQARLDVAKEGDGEQVLRLSTERAWAFKQNGTGENAHLELADLTGSKNFLINTTGNVGIGTTSPAAKLDVRGQLSSGGGGTEGYLKVIGSDDVVLAEIGRNPDPQNDHGYLLLRNANNQAIVEIGEGLDYAEGFSTSHIELEPGTVMIIDPVNPGGLTISNSAYDKRVAGIVAGASGLSSGVKLGSTGTDGEHPVALAGRVYCKVDGKYGEVKPGDLLTTSPNPGYAMVVKDHCKAQGAILGKAMAAMAEGETGEILVLVTLQ